MAKYKSTHTGLQIDDGVDKGLTALQPNEAIVGATKSKITYDANGLITNGEDLSANDIPNIDASKITSGTFTDERIASASNWNGKSVVSVADSGTSTNKAKYITINGVESQIGTDVDATPTAGSTNPVQSGGVKSYVDTQDGKRTRNNITNNLANLLTAIAEQNLEKYGYAIGDYFVGASGYKYHLADMDTYYGGYNSYAVVSTHHCGVVVDTLSTCQWLSSGSATSYSASTLHSYLTNTALPNIKSDITALFGDWSSHLLTRTELDNSVGGWGTTWTGLANCLICALSEVQMYGARVFGCDGFQTGTCSKPLELFAKYRWNEIFGNVAVWLKSLSSASDACNATDHGNATRDALTYSRRASGLILLH